MFWLYLKMCAPWCFDCALQYLAYTLMIAPEYLLHLDVLIHLAVLIWRCVHLDALIVHFNIWLTLWWLHLNIYFTLMFWLHCALQYFDYIVKSSAPWCFFDCTVKTWIAEHTRNTVFEWCDVRHTSHWVIKADCFSFTVKYKVWNLFCFSENSCWVAVSCKTSINWCPGNAIYHQGSKDLCHLQSQISWLRVQSFSCEGPLDWMWLL